RRSSLSTRRAKAAMSRRLARSRKPASRCSSTFPAILPRWHGIPSISWPRVIAQSSCNRSICFRKLATSRRWSDSSTDLSEDAINIRYVAALARLALTDEEIERFGRQLGDLLGHVNALSELDISSVPATAQVVESRNVTRGDDLRPCLDRETVLSQAPQRQGGFFRVPRIIAE